jgi:ribosomal-protein-alanine N-acetyltransferase
MLKKVYFLPRLILEKLNKKHIKDIHSYSKNNFFFKYLEFSCFKNISQTRKYINLKIKKNNFKNNFWWSVVLKKENKVIGTFNVHEFNFFRKTCEISYGIAYEYQNNGYFSEILRFFIKKIIKYLKFSRIQVITSAKNLTSIKSLVKFGFKIEGRLKKFYRSKNNNKNFDALILSKIR